MDWKSGLAWLGALLLLVVIIVAGCDNKDRENVVTYTDEYGWLDRSWKGGVVLHFRNTVRQYKREDTFVRIESAKCSSSCTMFLALNHLNKLCVSEGLVMRFHKPHSAPPDELIYLEQVMMAHYPQWVLDWLGDDGLRVEFETMPHEIVAQHVRICDD